MSPIVSSAGAGNPFRVIFIEELATLIGKAPTSFRTFATHKNYKNRNLILRPFKMPNKP